jgi:hypothetical protein
MRTGTIQNHDHKFIRVCLADLQQELVHPLSIHLATNLWIGVLIFGAHQQGDDNTA